LDDWLRSFFSLFLRFSALFSGQALPRISVPLGFGPGGYRYSDYTRVGVWLNVMILLLVTVALPLIWPLFP
jgi:hypothetical protein